MTSYRKRIAAIAAAVSLGATAFLATPAEAKQDKEVPYGQTRHDTLRGEAPKDLLIGTAIAGGGHHLDMPYENPFYAEPEYRKVLATQFSSVTPENQLKWEFVHPEQDVYNFQEADDIVAFAKANKQEVRPRALLAQPEPRVAGERRLHRRRAARHPEGAHLHRRRALQG